MYCIFYSRTNIYTLDTEEYFSWINPLQAVVYKLPDIHPILPSILQGESKKMSVSEKGSLITNGHFFDSPSSFYRNETVHCIKMRHSY